MFSREGDGRDYLVLRPDGEIELAGNRLTPYEAAEKYLPVLYLHQNLDYMRPERILFETVDAGDRFLFNYYVHWRDEIHPFPPVHHIYRIFRSAYYGSAKDIEYVQAGVSRDDGSVSRFAFERDPSGHSDSFAPRHDTILCERPRGTGEFTVRVNGRENDKRDIEFRDGRPTILVATWNHIYDFYDGEGILMDDPPLEPLYSRLYRRLFMSRRSRPPF